MLLSLLIVVLVVYVAILHFGDRVLDNKQLFRYLAPNLWLIGVSAVWIQRRGLGIRVLGGATQTGVGLASVAMMMTLILAMTLYWPDRTCSSLSYSAFLLVLLVPVAEELFFRGLLLDALQRHPGNRALAAALTSVIFGLVHLPQGYTVALVMPVLSLVLAALTLITRSLVWSVAVHLSWNALSVIRNLQPGQERWSLVTWVFAATIGLALLGALRTAAPATNKRGKRKRLG